MTTRFDGEIWITAQEEWTCRIQETITAGPMAIGIGMIAATLVSSAIAAKGKQQEAHATSQSDLYQAQVAQNNAAIARQNATYASAAGSEQAARQGLRSKATVGSSRAAEAASGVDASSGSYANVQGSESQLGELDALTIRSNAARQAYGYQVGATSQEAQSQLDKYAAANSITAGSIGATSSLLGGVSAAGNQYFQGRNAGVFG